MSTTVLTIGQLIESLENTRDAQEEDLYIVIGESVSPNVGIEFDDREETVEVEQTIGWAHGAFDDSANAMTLSREISHYLFGSLLVEEQHLSEGAIEAAQEGGDSK